MTKPLIMPVSLRLDSALIGHLEDAAEFGDSPDANGNAVRIDSDAVRASRAAIIAFANGLRTDSNEPLDPAAVAQIQRVAAKVCGLRVDSNGYASKLIRNDNSIASRDELTDKDGRLRRPRRRKNALSEVLSVRTVSATSKYYESRFLKTHGAVKEVSEGATVLPTVGVSISDTERRVAMLACKTETNWVTAHYDGAAAINRMGENAMAVQRFMSDAQEDMIVTGLGGTGPGSLEDLAGIHRTRLAIDYSGATPTLGEIFGDLAKVFIELDEVHDHKGSAPNALIAGSRLLNSFFPANNIDAGGSMTWADFMGSLTRMFDDRGITQVVSAPSLIGFGGNANDDGFILANLDGEEGLHQVVSMAPAPVRSYSGETADGTIWAMGHGGVDIHDYTDVVIGTAKVR